MKPDILKFFTMQRQIFGICPESDEFFRLSDCRIFLKKKPVPDWMDKITQETLRLEMAEERLDEKEEDLREKAREKGRRRAFLAIKKIDPVFVPRKLNPDDAKVIFHPVDYVVFNGMKGANQIKNIVFLDRKARRADHRTVQRSIERTIELEHYEWQTLRVHEDGSIKTE